MKIGEPISKNELKNNLIPYELYFKSDFFREDAVQIDGKV
jgi:hypothetical protein